MALNSTVPWINKFNPRRLIPTFTRSSAHRRGKGASFDVHVGHNWLILYSRWAFFEFCWVPLSGRPLFMDIGSKASKMSSWKKKKLSNVSSLITRTNISIWRSSSSCVANYTVHSLFYQHASSEPTLVSVLFFARVLELGSTACSPTDVHISPFIQVRNRLNACSVGSFRWSNYRARTPSLSHHHSVVIILTMTPRVPLELFRSQPLIWTWTEHIKQIVNWVAIRVVKLIIPSNSENWPRSSIQLGLIQNPVSKYRFNQGWTEYWK